MSSEAVTYESADQIAVITINRPDKANSLNEDVAKGLLAAWRRLNEGDDKVAILTGAGNKAFSAGADLKAPPENWRFIPGVGIDVEKPIIAAVDGWCVGAALVLVQFCDLCVATENAQFSYPEAKIGFSGGLIASLVARMPHKVVMELILVGDPLPAQRAYEVGFVNKVVAAGKHVEGAMEYARQLSANAPLVMAMLKRFTADVLPKGPTEISGIARRQLGVVDDSEDLKEGIASFFEKRPPNFTGR